MQKWRKKKHVEVFKRTKKFLRRLGDDGSLYIIIISCTNYFILRFSIFYVCIFIFKTSVNVYNFVLLACLHSLILFTCFSVFAYLNGRLFRMILNNIALCAERFSTAFMSTFEELRMSLFNTDVLS